MPWLITDERVGISLVILSPQPLRPITCRDKFIIQPPGPCAWVRACVHIDPVYLHASNGGRGKRLRHEQVIHVNLIGARTSACVCARLCERVRARLHLQIETRAALRRERTQQ